jgi:putative oxidoreductase
MQFEFFKRNSEWGPLFIRLIVCSYLIYGVQDNLLNWGRMLEFADFLEQRHVPLPLFSAIVSASTQFICASLILIGWLTRYAAIPLIINFIAALVIAHLGDSFRGAFPALMMLCASFFFLFHGAGKCAVDDWLENRDRIHSNGRSGEPAQSVIH